MDQSTIAVAVTYNPELTGLYNLLEALRPQVNQILVVDNGSANASAVDSLCEEIGARTLLLPGNLGIAAAQNRGILLAQKLGATHILLSDQDSLPAPNMVHQLHLCLDRAAGNRPVAAVGPVPVDARGKSNEALVYSFTTWGPKRRTIPGPGETLEVPFVLASGCLVPVSVFQEVGPLDESLFIDHVDLAWCLRAVEAGYRIEVCGDAILYHSLGDQVAKVPGRSRAVHVHSPIRNYYMMRNTLFLQKASFLPTRWKVGYLVWMVKYFGYYLLLAPGRKARIPWLLRALKDGVLGRGGPAV